MITKEKTNEFIDRAYKCACEHGFHDKKLSIEHFFMLVITEISEAVEADRKNLHANLAGFEKCVGLTYEDRFRNYVKDSVEDELADVCIRLYDICGTLGIAPVLDGLVVYKKDWDRFSFCEMCFFLCESLKADEDIMSDVVGDALVFVWFMCDNMGIDIQRHIELKMEYNESRPVKHGKKY